MVSKIQTIRKLNNPTTTSFIVHRNHFFHLYQKDKSSESKVKFRHASYRCKRVLEAAKLAYANHRLNKSN